MAVRRFLLRSHSMRSRIDHFEPVTYALPHTKINPGKTTVLSWGQGPLMTNHTQIDKGKTEIQFDKSRVSRGQNNDHDRLARSRTPVRWQSAPAGRWLLR